MIIIVFGLPGSGKTYFAEKLAEKIGAKHISSDAIRKQLVPSPTYSDEEKLLIYKKMFDIMYDYIARREHLILDGTFYKAWIRDNFIEQINLLSKDIKFIEVKADEATIKERLSHKRKQSDATFEIHNLIAKEFEPHIKEHLVLYSTNDNIDDLLEQAISYIAVDTKELKN